MASFLLSACGSKERRPLLLKVRARVDIVVFAPGGGRMRHMPAERAEWLVRKAARGCGRLARAPVEEPGWTIDAQGLLEIDPERRESRGAVTISLTEPVVGWSVQAIRSAERQIRDRTDRSALEAAIGKAMEAAASLDDLRRAPADELREALAGDDPERVVVAARALGDKHHERDVPPLIGLLGHRSPEVREAATGALVALGSRTAVRALIDAAEDGDPMVTIRTIDAVAALGGDEAVAYVELLASGHPLETVRRTAHQARRRMDRRERQASRR